MKVPITGNAKLDAQTVRAAIRLRAAGLRARAAAHQVRLRAAEQRQAASQRWRALRRRAADSRAGKWLNATLKGCPRF